MKIASLIMKNKLITLVSVIVVVAILIVGTIGLSSIYGEEPSGNTLSIVLKEIGTDNVNEIIIPLDETPTLTMVKPKFYPLTTYNVESPPINPTSKYTIEFYFDLTVNVETPGDLTHIDMIDIRVVGNRYNIPVINDFPQAWDFCPADGNIANLHDDSGSQPLGTPFIVGLTEANGEALTHNYNSNGVFDPFNGLNGWLLDGSKYSFIIYNQVADASGIIEGDIALSVSSVGAITVTLNSVDVTTVEAI